MIGVYCITNTVNGKRYIGQSWNIERRWGDERYGRQLNTHLTSSFKKYGRDKFTFEILVTVKETPFTQRWLDKLESKFIKAWDLTNSSKGYNKKSGGMNGLHNESTKQLLATKMIGKNVGRVASEETKAKLRAAQQKRRAAEALARPPKPPRVPKPRKPISEETKQKIAATLKGHPVSEKTRLAIAIAARNQVHSEETKQKMSASQKKRWETRRKEKMNEA